MSDYAVALIAEKNLQVNLEITIIKANSNFEAEGKAIAIGKSIRDFTPQDWALKYIEMYGQFDGGHHKQWVMDQVVRILKGTPIILELASWENGHTEYRFETGNPSPEYITWVEDMKGFDTESGEYQYDYDEGIAP